MPVQSFDALSAQLPRRQHVIQYTQHCTLHVHYWSVCKQSTCDGHHL